MAIHQEEGSEGAEASPTEASAPGKSPQVEVQGSGEALPGGGCSPQAVCDRDYAGNLSTCPRSLPPDHA